MWLVTWNHAVHNRDETVHHDFEEVVCVIEHGLRIRLLVDSLLMLAVSNARGFGTVSHPLHSFIDPEEPGSEVLCSVYSIL